MDLYAFVYRGVLAGEALRRAMPDEVGAEGTEADGDIQRRMPLELMDDSHVTAARKMAWGYVAIAAFENSARQLIEQRLLEKKGASWWTEAVSEGVRNKAEKRREEEEQIRWHGSRGTSNLSYVELGDLSSIINGNIDAFKPLIPSVEWARTIFSAIERSRNVVMHSGQLKMADIERVAMYIRDWFRQVGG
jgi:hypothetical protein